MPKPEDDPGCPVPLFAEVADVPRAGGPSLRVPFPSGGKVARHGSMSEVALLLALWDAGDLIDATLKFASGHETARVLMEACRDLIEIEDELISRGFSCETFTV